LPTIWALLRQNVDQQDVAWMRSGVRHGLAFVVLSALYALMYAWLPDIRQRLRTVLPGAIVGALSWVGAASLLSYTLNSAGKLTLVYGGFAGIVATLVFLYVSAFTLIFGAEFNAAVRDRSAPPADDDGGPEAQD
jgi:membrane protein